MDLGTAILGTNTNDCNIYGHDCCFIVAKKGEEIGFNLYLGGRVGVQASDTGLFVKKDEVVMAFNAVINLFKSYGFRDNRNKNRLHFLLEAVGMDTFVKAIKSTTGLEFENSGAIVATQECVLDESGEINLGEGLRAVHFSAPSGVFSGESFMDIASIAKSADGEIRLSVFKFRKYLFSLV